MGTSEVSVTEQWLREVCHDMRQPVACVLALAGAALAEAGVPGPARTCLEQIVEQAEWLADLIRRPPRAAAGGGAPAARADVTKVVREAAAAESVTWTGEMRVVLPAVALHAAVDALTLRRAVANVLGNATRAAGPDGTVSVVAESRAGGTMLVVEDSGPGFGQIGPGLGLGLTAVVRDIIGYGGRLECDTAALGGARVSIWLP